MSSSDYAIRIEGLGKRYRIGARSDGQAAGMYRYKSLRDSLGAVVRRPWSGLAAVAGREEMDEANSFWALKDVSFDVRCGEVIGIIGRNGAGKSTLLKVLSRITKPTTGHVECRGGVGSLLEVGTGFHPELTGRENIYLNGAVLGMTQAQVRGKFEEIVAFSEVEKFLDTPVKHYSSGMYTRLAFAVAANLEPEILVVDEVLAVGDAEFQKKCLGKMGEVANAGRTVLFVSHNMQAISTLCDRGVFLKGGRVAFTGRADEAIRQYLTFSREVRETHWNGVAGDDDARLLATAIEGGEDDHFRTDEPLRVRVRYEVTRPILGLVCAIEVYNQFQQRLIYSAVDDAQPPPAHEVGPGVYDWELTVPPNTLAAGTYRFVFDLGIHNVRRIVWDVGALTVAIENVGGIGRRFLAHPDVVRPAWPWRRVEGS